MSSVSSAEIFYQLVKQKGGCRFALSLSRKRLLRKALISCHDQIMKLAAEQLTMNIATFV